MFFVYFFFSYAMGEKGLKLLYFRFMYTYSFDFLCTKYEIWNERKKTDSWIIYKMEYNTLDWNSQDYV